MTVTNHCLSGGAIEVFLEPVLPLPRVLVAGDSPIVAALRALGPDVGLKVVAAQDIKDGVLVPAPGDLALLVAAHGTDEIATLRAGLEAGVRWVGLVASPKRGAAVRDELRAEGVAEELLDRLETPAGLDIGARTPARWRCRSSLASSRCAAARWRSRVSSRDATGDAAGELRHLVPDIETLAQRLAAVDYLADEGLATSMYLSLRLPQPLLLEGEAGVGKTRGRQVAGRGARHALIRLQCYDGIDAAEALYEWNYPRQLLSIRLADTSGTKLSEEDLFGRDYLIRRPLLRALEHPGPRPAVLLIDEIDRADDDFEAFLLELLADAAVTIPEIGTIRATHPPAIVLTSNRTRDLHDAVKRRCLYQWIDYPTPQREVEISVRRRVKETSTPSIFRPLKSLVITISCGRRALLIVPVSLAALRSAIFTSVIALLAIRAMLMVPVRLAAGTEVSLADGMFGRAAAGTDVIRSGWITPVSFAASRLVIIAVVIGGITAVFSQAWARDLRRVEADDHRAGDRRDAGRATTSIVAETNSLRICAVIRFETLTPITKLCGIVPCWPRLHRQRVAGPRGAEHDLEAAAAAVLDRDEESLVDPGDREERAVARGDHDARGTHGDGEPEVAARVVGVQVLHRVRPPERRRGPRARRSGPTR